MSADSLLTTPLCNLHREQGAKMVPFAGYDMPVQYPLGVLKEHQHTRAAAGLFDVSHMGQIKVAGEGAAEALEALMPIDVIDLPVGRQRYSLLTNDAGGVMDDLMVANCGEYFHLVVNAACKTADFAHLKASLPSHITCEMLDDRALLALQGPKAREVLSRLAAAAATMTFMDTADVEVGGIPCWVSCSGYTGEDGYELSVAASQAEPLAKLLLAEAEVEFIGLGARDSLRLEAGLCLYGHELSEAISPISANLLWAISVVRRPNGARAGGYPGSEVIAADIDNGVSRKRVLLDIDGKAPVRDGCQLLDGSGAVVGEVCSGGFGPSVAKPIAMAYVDTAALDAAEPLYAAVRNKKIPVSPRKKAYVAQRYYRG